ncbi:MAG: membrane dipeptidase [Phycisphaerales bacterium]|nr:membrane dipeptidase [Phycisphaerales bacterium]
MSDPLLWFDAHLDLAYLAVNGRDMGAPPESCGGPHHPAAVTLPSLREGGVRFALGTVFTEAGGAGPEGYPVCDAQRAHKAGRAQLEVYLTWRDRGDAALDLLRAMRTDPHVGEIRGGMGVSEVVHADALTAARRAARDEKLHLGVLIEGADPIRTPDELQWWAERGVVAVGMAWWRSSRYAGGNGSDDPLTDLGLELVRQMDDLGLVHDVSHLSDRSLEGLLGATERVVMASHSNCRALMPPGKDGKPNQRHLTDDAIREIARRGGIIGLNLLASFLHEDPKAAGVEDCVHHVEHVCELVGHRRAVGLGSDMDGGITAEELPRGLRRPADLRKIAEALGARGWSDAEVRGFAAGNWLEFWRRAANERPGRGAAGPLVGRSG